MPDYMDPERQRGIAKIALEDPYGVGLSGDGEGRDATGALLFEQFVSEADSYRPALEKPFTVLLNGEPYTVATNGRRMIALPGHRGFLQSSDGAYDLPASGRELDARVARDVMGIAWDDSRCRVCGWPLVSEGRPMGCAPGNCSMRPRPAKRADEPAHYSTSIADAWTVLEHMRGRGWHVALDDSMGDDGPFWCEFSDEGYEKGGQAWEATWPLAICHAALNTLADANRPAPQTE